MLIQVSLVPWFSCYPEMPCKYHHVSPSEKCTHTSAWKGIVLIPMQLSTRRIIIGDHKRAANSLLLVLPFPCFLIHALCYLTLCSAVIFTSANVSSRTFGTLEVSAKLKYLPCFSLTLTVYECPQITHIDIGCWDSDNIYRPLVP